MGKNVKIETLRTELVSLKEALEQGEKGKAKEIADNIVMESMNQDGTINMRAALPYIVAFASKKVFKQHGIQANDYRAYVIEENIQTVFTWLYDGRLVGWSGDPVCAIQNTISMKGTYIGNAELVNNFGFTGCCVSCKENNKKIYMHVPGISDVVVDPEGRETSIFDVEDSFDRQTEANQNLGLGGELYRSVEENVFGYADSLVDDVAAAVSHTMKNICSSKGLCFQDFEDFCVDYSLRGNAQLQYYGDAQAIMTCISNSLSRSKTVRGKIVSALVYGGVESEYVDRIEKLLMGKFLGEAGSKQFIMACVAKSREEK